MLLIILGTEAKKRNVIQFILHSLLTSIHGNCHGDKSIAAMFIKLSETQKKEVRHQNAVAQYQMQLLRITRNWIKTETRGLNQICKGWTILKNAFLKFPHSTFVILCNFTLHSKPSSLHSAYYDIWMLVYLCELLFSNSHETSRNQPIRARVRFN